VITRRLIITDITMFWRAPLCPVGPLAQWFMYRRRDAARLQGTSSWHGKKLTPASLAKPR
jgi:hypothetical protein